MIPTTRCLSASFLWEILTKLRIGKLCLEADVSDVIGPLRDNFGLRVLSFVESAALRESGLPLLHRDPFDRMLVCQAMDEGLTLVTPDDVMRRYPVETLW